MLHIPEYSGSLQGPGYSAGAEKETVRATDGQSLFFFLKLSSKHLFLKHPTSPLKLSHRSAHLTYSPWRRQRGLWYLYLFSEETTRAFPWTWGCSVTKGSQERLAFTGWSWIAFWSADNKVLLMCEKPLKASVWTTLTMPSSWVYYCLFPALIQTAWTACLWRALEWPLAAREVMTES